MSGIEKVEINKIVSFDDFKSNCQELLTDVTIHMDTNFWRKSIFRNEVELSYIKPNSLMILNEILYDNGDNEVLSLELTYLVLDTSITEDGRTVYMELQPIVSNSEVFNIFEDTSFKMDIDRNEYIYCSGVNCYYIIKNPEDRSDFWEIQISPETFIYHLIKSKDLNINDFYLRIKND